MRVGIDIDGVLTNLEEFHKDYGSKWCFENNIEFKVGLANYDINKTLNISEENGKAFWKEYLEFYAKNITARPFASEVIKKLKSDGYEIYIVTARWLTNRDDSVGENMRSIVKNWLIENEIEYDEIIFSKADNEQKTKEITDNKIDIIIEDSPKNINELSPIIPVICYDAEYNKQCIGDKIIRCHTWYDIYKKIKEIKNVNN